MITSYVVINWKVFSHQGALTNECSAAVLIAGGRGLFAVFRGNGLL